MIYQRGQNKSVDIPTFVGYNKTKGGVLMIYSIYEIQQRIAPVAKQYGVKAVFLFGSYAGQRYRPVGRYQWNEPAQSPLFGGAVLRP